MVHGRGSQRSPIHSVFPPVIHFIYIKEDLYMLASLYGSSAKYIYISRSFKRSIFQSIEAGR